MTTPSTSGWYFMSIPNDYSVRYYVQKTLDASNLDISLICVPLNKNVVRNDNENEMTDISLVNFVSSLNYNDGPVENYGDFTVNDWGKLSIFDYDTKLSLPTGISSLPCWVLLKPKVVPTIVIDTSLVSLKEYFGVNLPDTVNTPEQESNRPVKEYVVNKIHLNFPESTQLQKISYGGNILPLNGISNEKIVFESVIHNDVNNDPAYNTYDYWHYSWIDNYKYPKELYKESDLTSHQTYGLYNIRNKNYTGTMDANVPDSEKYDFDKMIFHSDFDSYMTLGDISYGKVTEPNVLVENVFDNSWLTPNLYVWESDLYDASTVGLGGPYDKLLSINKEKPSIINWTDISLGHKPLRWGPADRKEHIVNKDENLEILKLILDKNSTGSIELSYGNDLDNQIYYQKLYVNEGEISMNLVRAIPPGMIIDTLLRKIYLKGPVSIASTKDKVSMVDMTITWNNHTIDFTTYQATMDPDDSPHHNQLNDANAELGPLTVFDNLMPTNIVIGDWVTSSKFNYNENDPNGNTDFEEIFTRLQLPTRNPAGDPYLTANATYKYTEYVAKFTNSYTSDWQKKRFKQTEQGLLCKSGEILELISFTNNNISMDIFNKCKPKLVTITSAEASENLVFNYGTNLSIL